MLLEFHFWTITIAIISNYNKMMSAIAHTLKFELIAKLFAAIQSIWSYVLIYVTKAVCKGRLSLMFSNEIWYTSKDSNEIQTLSLREDCCFLLLSKCFA